MKRRSFTINVSPQTGAIIDRLHATGLFGLTREDVIERIIDERARKAVLESWAPMPKPSR